MKTGSLVVCIDNSMYKTIPCVVPELEPTIYTIRHIEKCNCNHPECGEIGLLLEEIRSVAGHREMMYPAVHFREVLPANQVNVEELFEREVDA